MGMGRVAWEARFDEALHSQPPLPQVRETVGSLLDQDWTREELLADLERLKDLRDAGRDEDEDVVLEVMDFLVGW